MRKVANIFLILCLVFTPVVKSAAESKQPDEAQIPQFMEDLFGARAKLFIDNDVGKVKRFYLHEESASRHAFQREKTRADYIQAWGKARGMKFINAASKIRIVRIRPNGDEVKVALVHSLMLRLSFDIVAASIIWPWHPAQCHAEDEGRQVACRSRMVFGSA